MKYISCKACESKKISLFYEGIEDYLFGVPGKWSLYKCNECSTLTQYPIATKKEILRFYEKYFTHSNNENFHKETNSISFRKKIKTILINISIVLSRKSWLINNALDFFIPRMTRKFCYLSSFTGLKVCDYGCGNGALVSELQKIGHQATGYDFDSEAINSAIVDKSLKIFHINDFDNHKEVFDRILLMNVIEHLDDPDEILKTLIRKLSENGMIYVETPNPNSLLSIILKSKWRGIETPRHLAVYTKKGLDSLFERHGLIPIGEKRVTCINFFINSSNITKHLKFTLLLLSPIIELVELLYPEYRESRFLIYSRQEF